jgi:hypothetical protein
MYVRPGAARALPDPLLPICPQSGGQVLSRKIQNAFNSRKLSQPAQFVNNVSTHVSAARIFRARKTSFTYFVDAGAGSHRDAAAAPIWYCVRPTAFRSLGPRRVLLVFAK